MSVASVDTVRRSIQSVTSAGGDRIWLPEAEKLVAEARADGRITKGERDILEQTLATGDLTANAAKLLTRALSAPGDTQRVTETTPNPSVAPEISVNGSGEPTINGQRGARAWNSLAEASANAAQSGNRRFLKTLPAASKQALMARAAQELSSPRGRSSAQRRQMRSNAFTVLYAVARSIPKSSATASMLTTAHQAMVAAAQAESHPRLGKHMTRLLVDRNYQRRVSSPERAETKALFEARFPQRYDVTPLLDAEGYVRWDHSIQEGEEMYRSFLLNVCKTPIGGNRFKIVDQGEGWTDFEVTFRKPRGENGEIKGIRLRARDYHDDMFDKVGQPVGISYNGHSGMGNKQEKSLANAVKNGRFAEKPQFIFLDMCAGQDGLDDALEQLGNVELITTLDSSRYWPDKMSDANGTFTGIADSELQPAIFSVWEGLTRGENYSQIRRRVKAEMDPKLHVYETNYIFGTLKDYRDVRWAHMDGDDDGVSDALDIHYRFGSTTPTRTPSLKLRPQSDISSLNGDIVRDAALDLNVCTHYNAFTEKNPWAEHVFTSGGFFDGSTSKELVRFVETRNANRKPIVAIEVNSRLAQASREALGALVHYEAMMYMAKSESIAKMKPLELELMALVFAGARLGNDANENRDDKVIWKELLEAVNLPTSIPYDYLAWLLLNAKGDFCGSLDLARKFKTELSPEEIAALKDASKRRAAYAA